jgi:hypothetical protein
MRFRIVLLVASLAGSPLAQSSGLMLHAETEANRSQFHMGEAITLNLTFSRSDDSASENWLVHVIGRDRTVLGFMSDRFIVSPESGTRDPWDYRRNQGIVYSGPGGIYLREKVTNTKVDLNQWVRFERPGFYRVRAVFHTALPRNVELESNDIGIEIIPADPAAQQEQLKKDIAILNAVPVRLDHETFYARMDAARRIAYLDTPTSQREAARLLGTMDVQVCSILAQGLYATQRPEIAAATMEELMGSSAQAVTPQFLDTLANLEARNGSGATPEQLSFRLASATEHKQDSARAISLNTLLTNLPTGPAPTKLRSDLAALFPQLPDRQQ